MRLGHELLLGLQLLHQVVVNFLRDLSQVTFVRGESLFVNLRAFKQDTSDLGGDVTEHSVDLRVNVVSNLLFLSVDLLRGQLNLLHLSWLRAWEAWEAGLHHWIHTLGLSARALATWTLVLTTRPVIVVLEISTASAATLLVTATWVLLSLVWSWTLTSNSLLLVLSWVRPHHFEDLAQSAIFVFSDKLCLWNPEFNTEGSSIKRD